MNVFRLLGDFCHLYSILVLIYKIHSRKTCAGISLKTRALYLLIFLTRYEDLFLYFVSVYNTFMKLLYLAAAGYTVYLMAFSEGYRDTWYKELDRFAVLPLIAASGLLGLVCTSRYSFFEISWTFSVVLESVAILPQLYHLTLVPTLPALPLSHLVALGLYRFFYVVNWVFRLAEKGAWDNTAFCFGVVQTIVWGDFLWVWYNRKQIKLPGVSGVAALHAEGNVEDVQTTVDEADMAQSFVLKGLFRAAVYADEKLFGGRGRVQQQLSVSAYPDHQVRIERGGSGSAAGQVIGHGVYRDEETAVESVPNTTEAAHLPVKAATTVGEGGREIAAAAAASVGTHTAASGPRPPTAPSAPTTPTNKGKDEFDVD